MPRKSKSKVNYASSVDKNRDGRTTRSEAEDANIEINPADLNDDVCLTLF